MMASTCLAALFFGLYLVRRLGRLNDGDAPGQA